MVGAARRGHPTPPAHPSSGAGSSLVGAGSAAIAALGSGSWSAVAAGSGSVATSGSGTAVGAAVSTAGSDPGRSRAPARSRRPARDPARARGPAAGILGGLDSRLLYVLRAAMRPWARRPTLGRPQAGRPARPQPRAPEPPRRPARAPAWSRRPARPRASPRPPAPRRPGPARPRASPRRGSLRRVASAGGSAAGVTSAAGASAPGASAWAARPGVASAESLRPQASPRRGSLRPGSPGGGRFASGAAPPGRLDGRRLLGARRLARGRRPLVVVADGFASAVERSAGGRPPRGGAAGRLLGLRRAAGEPRGAGRAAARRGRLDPEQRGDLRHRPGHALDHGPQLVGDGIGRRGRRHDGVDGGEGQCLDDGRPAVARRVSGERGGRGLGQPAGQLGREAHPGLRRAGGQPQRPHHTADVQRRGDVGQPLLVLLVLPPVERLAQRDREVPGGVVTSDDGVGRGRHDRAQVAQVELVDHGLGRVGPVEPVGHADPGEQVLRQRLDAGRLDGRLAFRGEGRVLVLQRLAHAREAGAEELVGDGLLLLGECRHQGLPMGAARLEPLGLGSLWDLGHRRERRTLAPLRGGREGPASPSWRGRREAVSPSGRGRSPVGRRSPPVRRSPGGRRSPERGPGVPVDRRGRGRPGPACRPGWSSRPGSRNHRGSRCARAPCGGCAPARPSGSRCPRGRWWPRP